MTNSQKPASVSDQPFSYPTLLTEILGQIPVRVFWKDADLRYLGCNALFAQDAGFASPEEVIGKDDFQMAWREQAESYRADDYKVMNRMNEYEHRLCI
jgi:PAS domain-containing protein